MGLPLSTQDETEFVLGADRVLANGYESKSFIGQGPNWLRRIDSAFSAPIAAVQRCLENNRYSIENGYVEGFIKLVLEDGSNEYERLHWRIVNPQDQTVKIVFKAEEEIEQRKTRSIIKSVLMHSVPHRSSPLKNS